MVNPYNEEEPKVEQVQRMFNRIAPTYDRLNRIISMGLDRKWRKYGIDLLAPYAPTEILDIATGTGDLAIDLATALPHASSILGVDISEEMMRYASEKAHRLGLDDRISFAYEDSTAMSFADESFDAVTIGFGIRNFSDIPAAAAEIYRVLRPSKPVMILELTEPTSPILRAGYRLYAKHFIPLMGQIISADRDAYAYLPRSIEQAPQRDAMIEIFKSAGFSDGYWRTLSPGVCTVYLAIK